MARFVRPDELHQTFNFDWLLADWSAPAFAEVIRGTLAAMQPVGAAPTWVLSNHDVVRHPTRYGGGDRGLARARAATLAMLALPGSAYLYQGEELGLEEVDVAPEDRQDPSWFRTGEPGRDGCRVPIPWEGDRPPYGFGPGSGQPWIPQPDDWAALSVAAQRDRAGLDAGVLPRGAALPPRARARPRRRGRLVEGQRDVLDVRRGELTVRAQLRRGAGAAARRRGAGRQRPGRGRHAAGRHRRLAALTPAVSRSGSLEGGVVAGELVGERDQLAGRPARRAAGRSARCARPATWASRARASSVSESSVARPSAGSGSPLEQAEVDEVLDLAADRALVDVELLDDGRAAHRAALVEVGEHEVRRRLQRPGGPPGRARR